MGFLTIGCLTEWGIEKRSDWQSTLNKQDGDLVNQTNIKTTACEKRASTPEEEEEENKSRPPCVL